MKKIIYLVLTLTLLVSCSKDDDTFKSPETLWIDSEYAICNSLFGEEYQCLSAQSNEIIIEDEWASFNNIDGFSYEEGYIYRVKVGYTKLDEGNEGPSYSVYLIELISKDPI